MGREPRLAEHQLSGIQGLSDTAYNRELAKWQADYGVGRDAYVSGNPESYIANHYKEYGFSKSTGLTADYKNAYGDDFTDAYVATKDMVNKSEYSPSAALSYLRGQDYDDETAQRILYMIYGGKK